MLAAAVTLIVRGCARVPWLIIVLGVAAAGASAVYSARHFAINTDVNKLISPDLDWRQRELEFEKLFPGHFGSGVRGDRLAAFTRRVAVPGAAVAPVFLHPADGPVRDYAGRRERVAAETEGPARDAVLQRTRVPAPGGEEVLRALARRFASA